MRFGTKAALLKRVVDVAVTGDTRPIDVVSRDWFQTALTAPTLDERIAAAASGSAALMARAGGLIAIAEQAAPVEPAIAAAVRAGREGTRDALRLFFARLAEDGLLPAATNVSWLADTASLLSQAQTYLLARDTLGWTSDQYQHWLASTLTRLIAAPGPVASQPATRSAPGPRRSGWYRARPRCDPGGAAGTRQPPGNPRRCAGRC